MAKPKNTYQDNNTTINASVNTSINNDVIDENKKLKTELEESKTELQELKKMILNLTQTQKAEAICNDSKNKIDDEFENYDDLMPEISLQKPIKVMSLTHGGLNLKTSNDSSATVFRFEFVGDTKPIIYNDLIKIISTQSVFFREGYAVVLDKDVIKAHYLEDAMKKVLTKKTLDNILSYDENKMIEIYTNTTKQLQDTIIDLVLDKLVKNEYVDRNKVSVLNDLCKQDLYKMAEHLRG
jgi:hypothetical protein